MENLVAAIPVSVPPSSGVSCHLLSGAEKTREATLARAFSQEEQAGSRGEPGEGVAIIAEQPGDVAAREALLDRAMGSGRTRKSSEKLRRGRRPSEGLAFVARDGDGRLVGTVRLWDVAIGCRQLLGPDGNPPPPLTPPHKGEGDVECGASIADLKAGAILSQPPSPLWGGVRGGGIGTRNDNAVVHVLLLGPLAVDPSVKSAGIGSALMKHAVAEARRLGHRAILLVGDAPYYARFGFSSVKTGELAMPGPYERDRFLALELVDGALDGACGVLKAAGRRVERRPADEAVPAARSAIL